MIKSNQACRDTLNPKELMVRFSGLTSEFLQGALSGKPENGVAELVKERLRLAEQMREKATSLAVQVKGANNRMSDRFQINELRSALKGILKEQQEVESLFSSQ